ncbi:MAG: DUF1289 domain-containing protein [Rhizobiaceae bacterium]
MDRPETDISAKIESPCNLVCVIDADTGYCFGCGRTDGEVEGWISYSAPMRKQIMDSLPDRMKIIKIDPKREARAIRRAKRLAQRDNPDNASASI